MVVPLSRGTRHNPRTAIAQGTVRQNVRTGAESIHDFRSQDDGGSDGVGGGGGGGAMLGCSATPNFSRTDACASEIENQSKSPRRSSSESSAMLRSSALRQRI